jgi:RNA polymerase sigma factor (sigma-70 family)
MHLVASIEQASKTLCDLNDDELMLLVKSERQDAFETLMRRHQTLVFGIATRYLGERAQGRDVMQDVFLSLWRERARYRPKGRFRSYLVAMTLHRCHTVSRTQKSQERRISNSARDQRGHGPHESLPIDTLVERERARELRQMLCKVPAHHRQVLVLRFAEGLALDEISEATNLPVGTVKSHLFRGLKTLRAMMRKESPL